MTLAISGWMIIFFLKTEIIHRYRTVCAGVRNEGVVSVQPIPSGVGRGLVYQAISVIRM